MRVVSVNDDHDIYLDGAGNLAVASDLEGLRQKVTSVLRTIRGEWILDIRYGVPYMEEIFIKGVTEGLAKNVYDKAILDIDEVIGISESTGVIDNKNRKFYYSANVQSIYGRFEVTDATDN
jgi:hypothetical protein